jgi:protein O-mannosyl-transferase
MTSAPGRLSIRFLPVPAVCAALLAVLLYLPTLDNPFVYDDFRLIAENPFVRQLSDLRAMLTRDITRPLVTLSYAIDTAVWGAKPFGYHLTNLVLHTVNVVLLYWLALVAAEDRRLRDNAHGFFPAPRIVGAATAVLAASHPAMTQAVGYVSARSELLYGAFFLVAVLAGRRWMRRCVDEPSAPSSRWRWITVAFFTLSLLSKEGAAMLPLLLAAYDWLLIEDTLQGRRARAWALYLPMAVVVAAFGLARLLVLERVEYRSAEGLSWANLLVALDAAWKYYWLYVLPSGQTILHTPPQGTALVLGAVGGALVVVAVGGAAWTLRRSYSLTSFGLTWSLLMLVPSSALVSSGIGESMAEHRAYVSAMGFFLAYGAATGLLWRRATVNARRRVALTILMILFVVQLAGRTLTRNDVWGDPVLLAQEAAGHSPDHWATRILLAEALRQSGRCVEAVRQYERAIAMSPDELFAYGKMASCLIETGDLDRAERILNELRRRNPQSGEAALGLGLLAVSRGQVDEARAYLAATAPEQPGYAETQALTALLDGSLDEPRRRELCTTIRQLAARDHTDTSATLCP